MPVAVARLLPRPRLSRRGGFAVVAYAFWVTMLSTTLPTPLYALYQARFGFSQLMITVIFATYAVGVIAALVLFGRLSDQVGRRRVLLPGLAFSALSAGAFLAAQGLGLLLVGRLISGLSAGIFTGTATAALVDLAPPERRDRATLVATMANLGGLGCGPLLAGALAGIGWAPVRLPFLVDLALLLPAAVGVLAMPETVRRRDGRARPQWPRVPAEVRAVFVRAALAGFAGFAVLGLFTAVAPAFLGQVLGIHDKVVVGLVVFAVFAASTVGQLALERVPGGVALVAGCAGLIAGMALLAGGLASASLALLVGGGCLAAFGQGLSFRAGLGAVTAAAPQERRGEVASAFFVVAYLALSVPVVGVGIVASVATLRTAGLLFAGMVAAVAAVVIALLSRGQRD